MIKSRYNFPLRMWCDVAVVSLPLFAIGVAADSVWVECLSVAVFVIGFIGTVFSLYYLLKDKPPRESPLSRAISMTATYVWPCILSGLIVDHFGNDALPFYILAGFVMAVILLVIHNDII